jgi:hypothetical protein
MRNRLENPQDSKSRSNRALASVSRFDGCTECESSQSEDIPPHAIKRLNCQRFASCPRYLLQLLWVCVEKRLVGVCLSSFICRAHLAALRAENPPIRNETHPPSLRLLVHCRPDHRHDERQSRFGRMAASSNSMSHQGQARMRTGLRTRL